MLGTCSSSERHPSGNHAFQVKAETQSLAAQQVAAKLDDLNRQRAPNESLKQLKRMVPDRL